MTAPPPDRPERLASLDAFRGLTIAGMILVNNAGDWGHVFGQLEHAAWNGCTATDLIFPFFLFIVGVAISISLGRRAGAPIAWPILRRTAILFGLGLLLNAVPFNLDRPLRIPGVLQRIAVVYLVAAPIGARVGSRGVAAIAAVLLALYWAALRFVPVPEFGAFDLAKGHDLGAWIDRLLMPGHLHEEKPAFDLFDPEGLLSTVPAIATALSGVLAGRWIGSRDLERHERASGLFFSGLVAVIGGSITSTFLPMNKSLWTPSYVLFTSGLACQALAACHWLVDLQGVRRWAAPFVTLGRNPILAFWASHAVARVLVFGIRWRDGERSLNAKQWLYETFFARGGSTEWTSVTYAGSYLIIWWAIMAWCDRRKIYLKV